MKNLIVDYKTFMEDKRNHRAKDIRPVADLTRMYEAPRFNFQHQKEYWKKNSKAYTK